MCQSACVRPTSQSASSGQNLAVPGIALADGLYPSLQCGGRMSVYMSLYTRSQLGTILCLIFCDLSPYGFTFFSYYVAVKYLSWVYQAMEAWITTFKTAADHKKQGALLSFK